MVLEAETTVIMRLHNIVASFECVQFNILRIGTHSSYYLQQTLNILGNLRLLGRLLPVYMNCYPELNKFLSTQNNHSKAFQPIYRVDLSNHKNHYFPLISYDFYRVAASLVLSVLSLSII